MSLNLHKIKICTLQGNDRSSRHNNVMADCTQEALDYYGSVRLDPGDSFIPTDPEDLLPTIFGSDTTGPAFYKAQLNFEILESAIEQMDVRITNLVGGSFTFSINDLNETPSTLQSNSILFSDNTGNNINYLRLGSDSDKDSSLDDSIIFDNSVSGKLLMKVNSDKIIELIGDNSPPPGTETIDMKKHFIFNSGYLTKSALEDYNNITGKSIDFNDSFIAKRFADLNYYSKNCPIIMEGDQTAFPFVLEITGYTNGFIISNNHGLNIAYNGVGVLFSSSNNTPTMLNNNTIYYLRYKDENRISLHHTVNDAMEQDDTIASSTKIHIFGLATNNNHKLTFSDLNSNYTGDYLISQAVPRKDLVLRNGDSMTGPLILYDHPYPYDGEELNDASLQAASRYYVEKMLESTTQVSTANDFSYVSFEKNDLLSSTGLYRMMVSGINISNWNINDAIHVQGNVYRNGIIQDIKTVKPNSLYIFTYSSTANLPRKGDIITNGTYSTEVLDNFDEIAQSRIHDTSHLSINVVRHSGSEKNYNDPVAEIYLNIKNNVINNNMIDNNAQISQFKLNINTSPIFTENDSTQGWNSDSSYKKTIIGLSAFSNNNFESNDGFIRIKPHGIDLNNIVKIPNNTVLGTTESDDNLVVPLSFSYIVEQGGGITDNNVDTNLIKHFDSDIFNYDGSTLVLKDNGVSLSKLQNIDSNTLLGRKSAGFGPVEVLSMEDVLSNAGGLTLEDLGSYFTLVDDKLSLTKNSLELNRLSKIPSMTVLGNTWNTTADVKPITLTSNTLGNTVVYRKNHGEISCKELQLSEKRILESTIDSLMAYVPTGQKIFTSWCGDSCDFHLTDTEFNGGVSAISFSETSDKRKKKNIKDISNAIDLISKLRGVTFDWKHDNSSSMGLIAQELENHIPSAVNVDSEGFKNVSYTSLIGLLIEGIKELSNNDYLTSPDNYECGTVVVIGEHYDCQTTNIKSNNMILGVVRSSSDNKVILYKRGKAKCKVLGKVNKGDVLVSSSIPGYAIVDNYANSNAIIGKSMSTKNNDSKGYIEIFVV